MLRLDERCPTCEAAELSSLAGGAVVCGACGAQFDAHMMPRAPVFGGSPSARAVAAPKQASAARAPRAKRVATSSDEMETMLHLKAEDLEVDHGSAIADPTLELTDPTEKEDAPAPHAPRATAFAQPPGGEAVVTPRSSSGPFSSSTKATAPGFSNSYVHRPRIVGDGGPPADLGLLVGALFGFHLLVFFMIFQARSVIGPFALVPSLALVFVTYYFWQGRNWARVLLIADAILELLAAFAFFAIGRLHAQGLGLAVLIARLALDAYFLYFCVRPDSVSFFEKRWGRP